MASEPHSKEHEQYVLGAVLLSDAALPRLLVDVRLTAEHFYHDRHAAAWRSMVALYDRGEAIDGGTVHAELERQGLERRPSLDYLLGLPNLVPALGNAPAYAARVVELAELREYRRAFLDGVTAAEGGQLERVREAVAVASGIGAQKGSTATVEQSKQEVWEHLEAGEVESFPLPFRELNRATAGGLKRGGVTLIGGWSSHGKSALLDQTLDHVADQGSRVHLYINEMTRLERNLRTVARRSGVPFHRLASGKVNDDQKARVVEHFEAFRYGITEVEGWSAEDIAFDIRRHRWDVAAVDILHLIEHDEERDIARISRVLNRSAKQADSHVIATVHLNERRVEKAERPPPTLGDIRGSGSLKNDADNVLFVYRRQTKDGTALLDDGRIYAAKVRNGELRGVNARFDGSRMQFLPIVHHGG